MKCKNCGSCQLDIEFRNYDPVTYQVKCRFCKVSYFIHSLEELEKDFDDMRKQTQIGTSDFQMVRTEYKKFLLVEDGSVDINDLNNIGDDIKVIVYRQGSQPPKFIDLGEKE